MYKICVYVPENSVETVKNALFSAGAGRIGNYDQCCWQTAGTGQFRPLDESKPSIGEQGKVTALTEIKIELVCDDKQVTQALKALKQSHPYEEPAYDVWKLEDM